MNEELSDETLNDFLVHAKNCPSCREELEVNFIVTRGLRILDEGKGDYNIKEAFDRSLGKSAAYMRQKKTRLRLVYCVDALVFWAVAVSAMILFRIFLG